MYMYMYLGNTVFEQFSHHFGGCYFFIFNRSYEGMVLQILNGDVFCCLLHMYIHVFVFSLTGVSDLVQAVCDQNELQDAHA